MVRLRVLGSALLDRDERPVTGRATQRHPLALLALLAASPGEGASRDKLIGYLWPETDARRARRRLSQALHVLRRGLGPDCVRTPSDGVVLNPDVVWSDVGAFATAVAEGRLEKAADLYGGPFLDGFFLSGSPAFDEWMESERRRLAGLYDSALERLVREADEGGDALAAAGWWRLRAEHDPCSTPLALGCIRASVAAGDRAGALRHARAHVALVQGRYDLPPDPAVLELVRELTRGTNVAWGGLPVARPRTLRRTKSPRPSPPSGSPARRLAVVAVGVAALAIAGWWKRAESTSGVRTPPRVAVQAFALDDVRDGGHGGSGASPDELADRIRAMLSHVPDVQILPAADTPVLPAGADPRVTSRALGAELIVSGRLRRDDGRALVTVRLRDVRTGGSAWTHEFDWPDGPAAVEGLSFAIAEWVRPRLTPFRPKRYTDDAWAYDRFLEGRYAHRLMTPRGLWKALQLYRDAYERDPAFALAHAAASDAYLQLMRSGVETDLVRGEVRNHAHRALALDSALAEGHTALAAVQIWLDGDLGAGGSSLRRAMMLHPELPEAHSSYGWYLLYRGSAPDAALSSFGRALELDPLNAARSYVLEHALYVTGRYEAVVEQHAATRSLAPDVDLTFLGSPVAAAYRSLGRYAEAIAEYRRIERRTGVRLVDGLGVTYARMGRIADARALLADLPAEYGDGPRLVAAAVRIHAGLGEHDSALHWLERAVEASLVHPWDLAIDPVLAPLGARSRLVKLAGVGSEEG